MNQSLLTLAVWLPESNALLLLLTFISGSGPHEKEGAVQRTVL